MVTSKARAVAVLATALLLGACGNLSSLTAEPERGPIPRFAGPAPLRPPPLDPPSAEAPPRLLELPPGISPNSSGSSANRPVVSTPPPAAAAVAIAPQRAPASNPDQPLYGLGSNAVVAALGPASFVRRDGPAEIWRYAAVPCFLDVFFYRENDGQKVNYVAARPRNANRTVTTDTCYRTLLAERGGRAAG